MLMVYCALYRVLELIIIPRYGMIYNYIDEIHKQLLLKINDSCIISPPLVPGAGRVNSVACPGLGLKPVHIHNVLLIKLQ